MPPERFSGSAACIRCASGGHPGRSRVPGWVVGVLLLPEHSLICWVHRISRTARPQLVHTSLIARGPGQPHRHRRSRWRTAFRMRPTRPWRLPRTTRRPCWCALRAKWPGPPDPRRGAWAAPYPPATPHSCCASTTAAIHGAWRGLDAAASSPTSLPRLPRQRKDRCDAFSPASRAAVACCCMVVQWGLQPARDRRTGNTPMPNDLGLMRPVCRPPPAPSRQSAWACMLGAAQPMPCPRAAPTRQTRCPRAATMPSSWAQVCGRGQGTGGVAWAPGMQAVWRT